MSNFRPLEVVERETQHQVGENFNYFYLDNVAFSGTQSIRGYNDDNV